MRGWGLSVVVAIVVAACAPAAAPPTGPPTQKATAIEDSADCDAAAARIGGAQGRLQAGQLYLALREVEEANRMCPLMSWEHRALELEVRAALGLGAASLAKRLNAAKGTPAALRAKASDVIAQFETRASTVANADPAALSALMEGALEAFAAADMTKAHAGFMGAWDKGQSDGRALLGAGRSSDDPAQRRRLFDRAVVEMELSHGAPMVLRLAPDLGKRLAAFDPGRVAAGDWLIDWRLGSVRRLPKGARWSPDRRWTVYNQDGVHVCGFPCDKPKRIFEGLAHTIVFTPDAKTLLIGSGGTLARFAAPSWDKERTIDSGGMHLWLSPDGADMVAVTRARRELRLFDTASGQQRATVTWPGDAQAVEVVYDGASLVARFSDNTWSLFDGRTGARRAELGRRIYAVEIAPRGDMVLVTRRTGLEAISALTGQLQTKLPLIGEHTFSADGRHLISNGSNARVLDLATGVEVQRIAIQAQIRRWLDRSVHRFVGVAHDALHVWDGGTTTARSIPVGDFAEAAQMDATLDHVVTRIGSSAIDLVVWSLDGAERFRLPSKRGSSFVDAALKPDGTRLAVVAKGQGALWALKSGRSVTLQAKCEAPVGFSANTAHVACGKGERATVFDVHSGKALTAELESRTFTIEHARYDAHWLRALPSTFQLSRKPAAISRAYPFRAASLSPQEDRIAWITGQNTVLLSDVDGERRRELDLERASSIAFSPDGRQLAVTILTGGVVLFHVHSGRRDKSLPGKKAHWSHVTYSGDGKRLAFAEDRAVVVWDLAMSTPIARLEDAPAPFALSHDGSALVTRGPSLRHVDSGARVSLYHRPGGGFAIAGGRILQTFGEPKHKVTDDLVCALRSSKVGELLFPYEICKGMVLRRGDLAERIISGNIDPEGQP